MSVSISLPMFLQFFNPNNSGAPAIGYQLFTYVAGTSTKQTTWTDSTQTVPNANPLALDSNGRAVVWGDPTLSYKFVIAPPNDTDPPGSPVWTTDNIQFPITDSSLDALITQSFLGSVLWPKTTAESASGVSPTAYWFSPTPVYDMQRYGIQANGVDNSSIVQAVYNMAKVYGGTLVFPPNSDFAFYLDISGSAHAQVFIDGQGSTFRPYTATPANSCIVYANNSVAGYTDTYVRFRNCNFDASLYPAQSTPVLSYGIYHNYACSRFYNCHFTYSQIGNVYYLFGQYGEFWDCRFDVGNHATTTAGCILDSAGLAASTNEVNFVRCEFFSNSVGLWLKGAQKTRLLDCTIQGNGDSGASAGAIILDADSTGSQTGGTDLFGCWFELNSVPNIYELVGYNTNVIGCMFWSTGGTNTIVFTHCSGIVFIGNQWPGSATVTINHPSGNTDCASLLWRGNQHSTVGDQVPVLNITHPGTYSLDLHWSGSFTGTLTGCTTSPAATFNYSVQGDCIDLHIPGTGLTATSSSTACTVTGLPAAIAPLTTVYGLQGFLEDSGSVFIGQCGIANGATTLTLYKSGSPTGFTSSGTKGINAGGIFRYPLYT